jgi:hypothetical protein
MLPGIRFLFAALVLWISILIFGLGAAALFRAAHEEVASIPVRRGPPERVFAQLNDPSPTLAMLRVDPPAAESPAATATAVAAVAPVADAPAPMESAEPKAVNTDDAPPAEAEKADTPAAEGPVAEPAPALADTAAPIEETKPAAVAETPATEPAPVASEAPHSEAAPQESSATSKIATLGGPPVTIEETAAAKAPEAKQDPEAVKKRALAQRARERRRLAQRARAAQQAAVQLQQFAYPFPMLTAPPRPTR